MISDKIEIAPIKSDVNICSVVDIPGSKSITNRAFLLSALSVLDLDSSKFIILKGCLESDDTIAFYNCLIILGFKIERSQNQYKFLGVARSDILAHWRNSELSIYCHDAGTAVRFLLPLVSALGGGVNISASEQMTKRPIQALLLALQELGVKFAYTNIPGSLPLRVLPSKIMPALSGGDLVIDTRESSQFISGILMVSPLAKQKTTLQLTQTRRQSYIDMTVKMMQDFGFEVVVNKTKDNYEIDNSIANKITNNSGFNNKIFKNNNFIYNIEPDASTASYFFALAAVTGGVISVKNLDCRKSLQGDVGFLSVLEKMGSVITYQKDESTGEFYTSIKGPKVLKGFGLDNPVDVSSFSDTFMTLAAIAPFADKPVHITGISHTRKQESDRVHAIAAGLKSLGVKLEEKTDDLIIYPADIKNLKGSIVSSFGDHRIAMSLALVGLKIPGVVIENAGAVSKTCPRYFEMLSSVSGIVN